MAPFVQVGYKLLKLFHSQPEGLSRFPVLWTIDLTFAYSCDRVMFVARARVCTRHYIVPSC